MIGEKIRIEDIPQDGIITVNGKKKYWYECYMWESMEQYEKWKKWAYEQVSIVGQEGAGRIIQYIDLRYGLTVKYKKEGELF